MRRCKRINSLPLVIIKSATPLPASVAPIPVLALNTLSQLLSDGSFHQLTPILKTPIPENSRYHNVRIYRRIMPDCWECCFPNMHRLVYRRLMR